MYTEKQTIYPLYSSIVHTNVHVNLIGNLFNTDGKNKPWCASIRKT